jgi:hypothetical protein
MKKYTLLALAVGTLVLSGRSALASERDHSSINRKIQGQTAANPDPLETAQIETRSVIPGASKGSAQEMIRRRMEAL